MRYRVGWPVPGRVLALTHFSPDVTAEDYAGIMAETAAELRRADRQFHLLIDNSRLANETVAALGDILAAAPALRRPDLRWIVMVLPASIKQRAQGMATQRDGEIRLRYVGGLDEAFAHLRAVDETMALEQPDPAFFAAPGAPA